MRVFPEILAAVIVGAPQDARLIENKARIR